MTIIRTKKDRNNPYVQINRKLFDDNSLSLKAKGFIAYCLSKPDDWEFYVEQLASTLKENKTAIYSAIKEAEKAGYCIRFRHRDSKGRLKKVEYIISDSKEEILYLANDLVQKEIKKCLPHSGFPDVDLPDVENVSLLKNKEIPISKKTTNYPEDPIAQKNENSSSFFKNRNLKELEDLIFSKEQKETLYKSFTDDQILQAINLFRQRKSQPDDLGAYLYMACKKGWKPKPKKEDVAEINKAFAQEKIGHWENSYLKYGIYVSLTNKCVEIISGQTSYFINYDQPDFMEKLKDWARKLEPELNL
jgi:hypothetical protein